MTDTPITERVQRVVMPILADLGLVLYDLELAAGVLRITVDVPADAAGADGADRAEPPGRSGLDLDTIALVARLVGRELDHDDPIPGRYTLEVSSPGLERALRTPAHFRAAVGRTVTIRLRDVVDGVRRVHGTLTHAGDEAVTVRLDQPSPDGAAERTVGYDHVDRARTVFVWQATPKPVGPRSARRAEQRAAEQKEEVSAS